MNGEPNMESTRVCGNGDIAAVSIMGGERIGHWIGEVECPAVPCYGRRKVGKVKRKGDREGKTGTKDTYICCIVVKAHIGSFKRRPCRSLWMSSAHVVA